ncbi:hypothetical protein BpHYR1_006182 [Brachionus plicatilis]|uniref:Uncharacterized protein n=1 Tax=Brachionus plicatilis TaxID=10195 RepID=A0A3M7PYF1_BRAPC|nr:hypothetical protein BpHYR1_006182 [Brachionus plicatilis]
MLDTQNDKITMALFNQITVNKFRIPFFDSFKFLLNKVKHLQRILSSNRKIIHLNNYSFFFKLTEIVLSLLIPFI